MIPKAHRQWMLLVGLMLALVIVVTYQMRGTAPATTAPAPSNSVAAGRGGAGGAQVPVTGIRLEELQASRGELPPAARNPFRFRERAAPPPPAATRPPEPIAAPPVPTGPPPPPPIPLRLFGIVERSPRLALLSDGRGAVFEAKDGDIIDGRYRLLRVGPDSADLSYVDGRGRQTFRMSAQ